MQCTFLCLSSRKLIPPQTVCCRHTYVRGHKTQWAVLFSSDFAFQAVVTINWKLWIVPHKNNGIPSQSLWAKLNGTHWVLIERKRACYNGLSLRKWTQFFHTLVKILEDCMIVNKLCQNWLKGFFHRELGNATVILAYLTPCYIKLILWWLT